MLRTTLGFVLISSLSIQSLAFADQIRPINLDRQQIAQLNNSSSVIFVSPNGVDAAGAGSQSQPLRTISAALSMAQAGTVIQIASGTYSTQSGEVFPLRLQPGVQIQGDSNSKGQSTVISGGGKFVSPTFASQNITMLAAHNAQIVGVKISNSNPRGYGLWVESSKNVAITNNTFANNTHDGIFLTGDARTLISENLFTKNRGSGISAVGSSSGEIRGNRFDNTGFGLSIGQRSTVLLTNNQIVNNVDGVVISNISTPTLRGNSIVNNSRNGLVVLKDRSGQPTPDLGTQQSPGRNVFRSNKQRDINNVSGVALIAAGNEINLSRVTGKLDTSVISFKPPTQAISQIPVSQRSTLLTVPAQNPTQSIAIATPPQASSPNQSIIIAAPSQTPIQNIPTPSTITPSQPPRALPPLSSVIIQKESPTSGSKLPNRPNQSPNRPVASSQPVALPPPNMPISNSRSTPIVTEPTSRSQSRTISSSLPPSSLRYRVIVPVSGKVNTQEVRRVSPDAFTLKYRGKTVVQVGAFGDRDVANAKVKLLADSGFKAVVVDFK